MKRIHYLLGMALFAGALATSCANTKETDPEKKAPVPAEEKAAVSDSITFKAVLEAGTKTSLGEGDKVCWNQGDCIKVFNASNTTGVEYSLQDGAGTPIGTFGGPNNIGNGPFWAVYPAAAATSLDGDVIHISVPDTQVYAADSFGPGANVAAGKADQLDEILFRNRMGALALTLTGTKSISSIRILSYQEEPLFGTATLSGFGAEETPALTFAANQTETNVNQLTLSCGTPGVTLTEEGKTFYLTVPDGALAGGYMIEVYDTDGTAMARYAKASADNRIARSQILEMPVLAYTPDCKTSFLQSDAIGAYSGAFADGTLTPLCQYVELQSQYAYKNTETTRYLRIEDMNAGYALGVTMPYALNPGKSVDVTINQAAGITGITKSETAGKMRVVKVSEGKVWLLDRTGGTGFIFMMAGEE